MAIPKKPRIPGGTPPNEPIGLDLNDSSMVEVRKLLNDDQIKLLFNIFREAGINDPFYNAKGLAFGEAHTDAGVAALRLFHQQSQFAAASGRTADAERSNAAARVLADALTNVFTRPEFKAKIEAGLAMPIPAKSDLIFAKAEADVRKLQEKLVKHSVSSTDVKYHRTEREADINALLNTIRGGKRTGIAMSPEQRAELEEAYAMLSGDVTNLYGEYSGTPAGHARQRLGYAISSKSNLMAQVGTLLGKTTGDTAGYSHTPEEENALELLKVARLGKSLGAEVPEETRAVLKEMQISTREELQDLYKRLTGDSDPLERTEMLSAVSAKNKLLSQLDSLFKESNKETKTGLQKVISGTVSLMGIFSIASNASRVLLQDPYTYGTRPAISALSQQGDMGALIGSALSQNAQFELGWNQTTAGTGFTAAAAGLSLIGAGKPGLGGTLLAVGGTLSALGLTGHGDDFLRSLNIIKSKEEIMGTNIAQNLLDPKRSIGNWQAGQAGMMALNAGQANFGYYYDAEAEARMGGTTGGTGNYLLDAMIASTRRPQTAEDIAKNRPGRSWLYSMGITADDLAGLTSTAATQLAGRGIGIDQAALLAARTGGAFGLNPEAMIGMMGTAQSFGSKNIGETLRAFIGGGADAEGNISTFTVNAISQALLKTTESLKLQNLVRNSDELQKEVISFRMSMVKSGSALGDIIQTNPQVFDQVMQMIQGGIKRSLDDPSMMALDLSLGSSVEDIVTGKMSVMSNRISFFTDNAMLQGVDFGDPKSVFGSNYAIGALFEMRKITGIDDVNVLMGLIKTVQEGGDLDSEEVQKKVQEAIDSSDDEVNTRVMGIVESKVGELISTLSEQAAAMTTASQAVMHSNLRLNEEMMKFIGEGGASKLMEAANKGIAVIEEQTLDLFRGDYTAPEGAGMALPPPTMRQQFYQALQSDTLPEGVKNYTQYQRYMQEQQSKEAADREEGAADHTDNSTSGATTRYAFTRNAITTAPVVQQRGGDRRDGYGISRSNLSSSGETAELSMSIHGVPMSTLDTIAAKAIERYVKINRLDTE